MIPLLPMSYALGQQHSSNGGDHETPGVIPGHRSTLDQAPVLRAGGFAFQAAQP